MVWTVLMRTVVFLRTRRVGCVHASGRTPARKLAAVVLQTRGILVGGVLADTGVQA